MANMSCVNKPDMGMFQSDDGFQVSAARTLRQVCLDGITILVDKYVQEFEAGSIAENLKTRVIYSVFSSSNLTVHGENSFAALRNVLYFLDSSVFIDVHAIVDRINILSYLLQYDMRVSMYDLDYVESSDIDTCGEYMTYYFENAGGNFKIKRFNGDCHGIYDLTVSFVSLQQAKQVIEMMLQDIEKNPGPVFSRMVPKNIILSVRDVKQPMRRKTRVWWLKQEAKAERALYASDRFQFQMHKMLPHVVKTAGYAAANVALPGAGTGIACIVEGAKASSVLDTIHKSADDFKECVAKTAQQFPHLLDTAEATVSNANIVIQSLGSIIEGLKSQKQALEDYFGKLSVNPMHILITIMMAFVALAYPSFWTGVPAFFFVLNLLDFDRVLIQKLRQICGYQFQAAAKEKDLVAVIGQVIFTLFTFFGIGMIPPSAVYDSLLRRLDLIPKSVKGAHAIWEKAGEIYQIAETEFRVYILNQDRSELNRERGIYEELSQWVERVEYYYDAVARKEIERNQEAVTEVTQLFQKMSYWLHTRVVRQALPAEVLQVIVSLQPRVNEIYKLVCRSTVHEGGPRVSPLCVMFSGGSKVGKSELLIPLGQLLLHGRGYNDENDFYKNNMYVRTAETEYWDGYVGQKICIVDDAFQIRDTVGAPSVEFMESIRLCNTAPCQIHCADLNDKGRFFSSEIVLYTTNLTKHFHTYIQSLNCPEAAVRRLNSNAFRVTIAEQYSKQMVVGSKYCDVIDARKICYSPERQQKYERHLELARKLGREAEVLPCNYFCVECKARAKHLKVDTMPFCTHAYRFQRYDLGTDEDIGGLMCWRDMVQHLLDYDQVNMKIEQDKIDNLKIIGQNPEVFFQANEEFEDPDAMEMDFYEDDIVLDYDLNKPEHWRLWVHLNEQRRCYDLTCERDGREGSKDDFLAYLGRFSELGCFSEAYDAGRVRPRLDGQKLPEINDSELVVRPPLPVTVYRRYMRKVLEKYEKVKLQIKEFYESCNFLKFLTIAGIILGVALAFSVAVRLFTGEKEEQAVFESDGPRNKETAANRMKATVFESDGPRNKETAPNRMRQAKFESDDRASSMVGSKFAKDGDTEGVEMSAVDDLKLQGLLDVGAHQISTRLGCKQMYVLHNDHSIFGNIFFVKGYNMLINKHYIYLMAEYVKEGKLKETSKLYMSNTYGVKQIECTVKYLLSNAHDVKKTLTNGEVIEVDACIVPFDPALTKCPLHGDMTKLFITASDIGSLSGVYKAVLPTYNTDLTAKALGLTGGKPVPVMPTLAYKWCASVKGSQDRTVSIATDGGAEIKFRNFWIYDGTTTGGDCGAPLIIQDTSAARKIIGIHSAGRIGIGMAQCLTREMIQETLDTLPVFFQSYVDIPLVTENIDYAYGQCGSVPLNEGLIVEGLVDNSLKIVGATDTKIEPSVLNGQINGAAKTAPTLLKNTGDVDPMYKGLVKFGKYVPLIDPQLIDVAATDVSNNLEHNVLGIDKSKYARVLTYDEAVLGVEDDEFLAPINRKTSMGFPYTRQYKLDGKRQAFGHDEWTMDTKLAKVIKADVETLIDHARNGVQTNVYWTDTLKMERRDIAKVKAGKTRVFCAGPVHFTLAFRQYFLGFAAWLMHNRNANEISPGTNVYSTDWDIIARKILSKAGANGDGVVAGDFSNFDGSLNGQILWHILNMINDWYDDGEENATIRRGLWFHIVNAIHINGRVVYRCTHSQPSGCPLTAILNSVYNSIVVRIVYLICAREANKPHMYSMEKFNEYVAMVAYGDDNLIAILEDIRDWFNQVTITRAFLEIGHEYTDEAKTGHIVEVRNLSECAYLKRKFIFDKVAGRHIAPLALDVILEIPQWTKKGTMRDQITVDNVDVCMRELALHERHVFDHYYSIIRKKCIEFGVPYRFRTYMEYKADVLEMPVFQNKRATREYKIVFNDIDFSCQSEETRSMVESGEISQRFVEQMQQAGPHAIGYFRIEHTAGLVHFCWGEVMKEDISPIVRKLEFMHRMVKNATFTLGDGYMTAEMRKRLCNRLPWLKCDL